MYHGYRRFFYLDRVDGGLMSDYRVFTSYRLMLVACCTSISCMTFWLVI